ncbi:putative inactive leucine-rich repeat receptor-like protein kinase At1g66830 [Wolffia australiana]
MDGRLFLLSLVCCTGAFLTCTAISADGLSLLTFKSAVAGDLGGWNEGDADPCGWPGVSCAAVPGGGAAPRVVALAVPGRNLSGYIPSALGSLLFLRRLDLAGNRLSGGVPAQLSNARSLHSLLLSSNNLSGPLPPSLCDLPLLQTLDLSLNAISGPLPPDLRRCRRIQRLLLAGNRLSGEIPAGIWSQLAALRELDLSRNDLSGGLPPDLGSLPTLSRSLNLSFNRLSGEIPPSWAALPPSAAVDLRFNNLSGEIPFLRGSADAFAGNPFLCGEIVRRSCNGTERPPPENRRRRWAAVVGGGVAAAAAAVAVAVAWVWWRARIGRRRSDGGDLVAVDEGFECEKEELLGASAYVMGKGGMGIVYKVVLASGEAVAVRRLGGGGAAQRRRDFAGEVAAIARVRHPNVVRLKAYCWSTQEKLLVSEFVSHCCLASLLRQKTPLSLAERLQIARGTARGLACIHETGPRRLVHGGIRPCNILLDGELNPRISDLGLARLAGSHSPSHYLPPEALAPVARPAQAWDVFSFGILLLELLTGRAPDAGSLELAVERLNSQAPTLQIGGLTLAAWARSARTTDQLLDPALRAEPGLGSAAAAIAVALGCAEIDPNVRPKMRVVTEELDKMAV